jgi:cyclic pyranopterin phosphate synthase
VTEPAERRLIDGHGRAITYVRISITDRCNLRCVYCMPEDQTFRPLPHLMTRDEIRRAARLLQSFGVSKVRLTGGEPTTRPDLVDIVSDLHTIGFPGGIALSTNGVLFPKMAHALVSAGLDRVNISLDAVEAEHFRKLTRRDHLQPVLNGIELALTLPFESVKVNVVVLRGFNDDQVLPLAALTRDRRLAVRFIEFMPFGDNGWTEKEWVGWEEVYEKLVTAGYLLTPVARTPVSGPAEEYHVESLTEGPEGPIRRRHLGAVGFITPISDRFCDSCNRMRLTQDGFLKGCLFGQNDVDLLKPMRAGASDEDLSKLIQHAAAIKEERHPMFVGMSKATLPLHGRNMSEIGG